MKKLIATILIAASAASAGTAPPQLKVFGTTEDSIVVEVVAGSLGTPNGFRLYWQSPQQTCDAVFLTNLCPVYALTPNSNIAIVIGHGQCTGCHIDTCYGIECGTVYALWVVANGQQSQTVYCQTQPCN